MIKADMSRADFEELKNSDSPLVRFTVVSGSMAPLIAVGENVVVEKSTELQRFDIIVFWQNEKLVCHVLWHKNRLLTMGGEEVWVTKPLLGKIWDLSIQPKDVLGKVVSHQIGFWWRLKLTWIEMMRVKRK